MSEIYCSLAEGKLRRKVRGTGWSHSCVIDCDRRRTDLRDRRAESNVGELTTSREEMLVSRV